jgi:Tol biopolymer transport system component
MGVRRRWSLGVSAVLIGLLAAAVLPGVARPHHSPPVLYHGSVAATTPDIDGQIGAGEWTDTPSYAVNFGTLPATVRFKHDAAFLYIAFSVTDNGVGGKSITYFFDDNHDGIKNAGEDAVTVASGGGEGDFYFSSAGSDGATHYADVSTGGTNPPGGGTEDVLEGATDAAGTVTFEVRHPLCSEDAAHDFCVTPGSVLGVQLQYKSGGSFFGYPGASPLDPSDWADLTIAAVGAAPTGQIVFESNRAPHEGNLEIYRMNADGSAPTRLTDNSATDNLPSISPDGTKVAFSSDRGGNADIYVMNIDGSGVTQLTSGAGIDLQPAWSPDGTKIAYHGSSIEQFDIFVVDATGGTPIDVTNSPADEASASWSPDGTQLAFMSDRDGNDEVYRQNADGLGAATRLTNNPARDSDPDWSPDGQKLAFFSDRTGSAFGSVWTINASEGSNPVNLTNATIFDADPSWSPDGTHIAFVRDAGGQNFNVWTALADGTAQVNLTNIGGRNSFPDWGPLPNPLTASISITGPASSDPGARSAAIAGIPLDAIRGEDGTTSAAPLGGIPLGGIPLGGIPLGGIPLGGIPLGGIGGIGFTAANLNQNGLGGVPLSTIPLVLPDRWESHLALDPAFAGTPPQNVTLAQVLDTAVVNGITLDDLNLASSPLGGIPLAGIALGGIPLGGIPLGGIAGSTDAQNRADWCAYINQQDGFSCAGADSLIGQTMLGLALQGVPLGGIPLGGIPLGGIPLGGIPLGGIPVGTPLGGIPLGGINLLGTPLGGIPLGGIDMSVSPLGGIQLGSIPATAKAAIFNCPTGSFTCANTDTLAAAAAAGAIKATAKLEDLGYYKNASGQDITLAQLIQGLPPDTTLEDLLATILLRTAYDWEALPLPEFPLQDFSPDGGVVTYTVNFTVNGASPGTVDGSVAVHMPQHARYVENSTQISGSAGVSAGEPSLTLPENELTWSVSNIGVGTAYTLSFRARPGLSIGTETATAKIGVTGLGQTVSAPSPASTVINEPGEAANGNPSNAQQIQADTLYLGYTSSGDDRDYFKVNAQAGEQLIIHLSHLKVDADLVVYGPNILPLRTPHPAGPGVVAGDVPFDLEQRTQSITPEALTDVPQGAVPGQSVLDVSDNRGLADEEVAVVSPEGGTYTIQVAGFDGAFNNDPWMLRVERLPALLPPELFQPQNCTNPPTAGGGVVKPMPTVPANASTLYLFASKRFGDVYGLAAEDDVWNRLQTLAGRTDAARGAVIPVDANPAVLTALEARASDSCSPAKANNVVRAVGALLDNPQIVRPSVTHIVVVGDDAAGIPFGRILDNTAYANERGYASTFFGNLNNAYLSTYGLSFLPTDDPLGDINYSGQGPYVPELAVGRLVETPAQILAQITQYITRNGAIAPTRALTTGYDFLKDGATKISSSFRARYGSNAKELINDTWSKTDLINAMFPASNVPQIVSLNAHFDHSRSLPADESAAQRETILFTTADLAGRSTDGRVIFSMGCHSALPVSDFVVADPLKPDWSQAFAESGAIVYAGNTGYGLGDTAAVLYSEKLNALFAERLDGSMTIGQALAFAKQEYGTTPTQSGYHLKVIDQATMMGLPMYRLGTGAAGPPPVPPITTTDSATGLPVAPFSVSPTFTRVNTPIGSYYTSDDIFAENRRPIEPTTKLDVTQPNGLVPHGALITALTSTEETGFDAAFSRVVDDKSSFTPELVGDVTYPTKLQSIASLATPLGTRQRLTLFTGQFRSDGVPEALGIGTQRRFTNLAGSIFYAAPTVTDFTPPTFGPVTLTRAGGTVAFAVDVTDNVGGEAGVKRVVALYRDESGTWKSIEMSHGSPRWSGSGPLVGTNVEWMIQGVDASGDVGITANKAIGKSAVQPDPTGGLSAVANGTQQGGWFTGSPTVTITGPAGVGIKYSLDGDPFVSYTAPFTVSGTGVHTVDFQGTNGGHGTLAVPVDVSPPTVTVNSTYGVGEVARALCSDAGSGIASCSPTTPLDTTSLIGPPGIDVQVSATDRAGHSFSATLHYEVKGYTFAGFFSPIMNPPAVNTVNAGSSVPIKFSLGAFRGLSIFAQGFPATQPMTCAGVITDPRQETVPPGSSTLTYNPSLNQYQLNWKTESRWRNTCRRLNVRLKDGVDRVAFFSFK